MESSSLNQYGTNQPRPNKKRTREEAGITLDARRGNDSKVRHLNDVTKMLHFLDTHTDR